MRLFERGTEISDDDPPLSKKKSRDTQQLHTGAVVASPAKLDRLRRG